MKHTSTSTSPAQKGTASQKMPIPYSLQLYVVGTTPASSRAIVNVRKLCEEHLAGQYELDVVDLSRNPALAAAAQIIAAPTLIKRLPLPARRFIGDMSRIDRVLAGLGVVSNLKASLD